MNPRTWHALLIALIAIAYALVAIEAAQCRYLLVNDYIAFSMIRIGAWPGSIARSLFDASIPLFRPFPDLMAWIFATLFRSEPGVWHVALIAVRLLSAGLAFAIARQFAISPAAAATGAAYFAFFPAIPEIDLLRAENWLIPALAAAFLGWLRLSRGGGGVAWTAIAFVAATMSKEVAAPLCAILFVLLAPLLWRRGAASRAALAVMSAALLMQTARCALMLADPYAQRSGGLLLFWTAKVLLLAATSFPLLSLLLAALLVLGGVALVRRSKGAALLLAVSIAMAVAAPYPAIRYAYPAALFLVPCVTLGVDELRRLARGRVADAAALATTLLLAVFGGANLWGQAVAMRASTQADWQLLERAASAFAAGTDVVVIEDPDFERALWIRAELVGVDPRWPFLTYVARQYAQQKPVVWPPPPAGAVNLTGLVPASPRARFLLARAPIAGALVIPGKPTAGGSFAPLDAFARFARLLNPRFHYAVDLGESPYPGHYWVILSSSRRISRAGLPPTSVNGSTSRVTTDAAATTAPRPM